MTPPPDSNGIAGGVEARRIALINAIAREGYISGRTGDGIVSPSMIQEAVLLATTPDPTARTGKRSIGNPMDVAAMREAAALVADRLAQNCEGTSRADAAIVIAHRIRALPLPGEAS